MIDTGNENLNDASYWDQVYMNEWGSGKRRIDNERLGFLIGSMKDWRQYHTQDRAMLLDVGCGNGELLRLVHAELPDWDLSGVDITPQTITKAQACDPSYHYQVGTIYGLPFNDNSFSTVFCGETIEHLDNPEAAIAELARVTAPGGYLVISLPCNHNNYSPEHLKEFSVWDAIKLTEPHGQLMNMDVKVGGLSIIWTIKKHG